MGTSPPPFDAVERTLRRRTFATLSTLTDNDRPHATGVVYALSLPGEPLSLFVTTNVTNKKVANIRAHPDVAVVVPLSRRLFSGLPPACLQFQGVAHVLDGENAAAIRAFQSSLFLRTILRTEHRIVAAGGRICFLRIRPDPVIFTYGFGMSLLSLRRHAGRGANRVAIPAERQA